MPVPHTDPYEQIMMENLVERKASIRLLLDRKVNPTLYTNEEFNRRRARGNPFLKRVLDGPVIILSGSTMWPPRSSPTAIFTPAAGLNSSYVKGHDFGSSVLLG